MKSFTEFLTEISNSDLTKHYDDMEKKHAVSDKKTDIEHEYGKEVHMAGADPYGKHHRPGIDFVHDPAHADHPLHKTAERLGYKYSSSHKVMGKPFHVYTHKHKDMGVRNMALTHSKSDKPSWSFSSNGVSHHSGEHGADLEKKVNSHVAYLRKKHGLKKVPGVTA